MVISKNTYTALLKNPEALKNEHLTKLKEVINQYPFFQSARALHLITLKNTDSFRYNHELKITAAHTTDRATLFDFITSEIFKKKEEIYPEIKEDVIFVPISEPETKQEPITGKPFQFTEQDKHSFNEWLQLSTHQPIARKQTNQKSEKEKMIDRFIESNPKIIPISKGQEIITLIPELKSDKSLMTETLAQVYLEQKKYAKAIKAYEILSLKYPEKSGFFADQIKRIKILKQKKL